MKPQCCAVRRLCAIALLGLQAEAGCLSGGFGQTTSTVERRGPIGEGVCYLNVFVNGLSHWGYERGPSELTFGVGMNTTGLANTTATEGFFHCAPWQDFAPDFSDDTSDTVKMGTIAKRKNCYCNGLVVGDCNDVARFPGLEEVLVQEAPFVDRCLALDVEASSGNYFLRIATEGVPSDLLESDAVQHSLYDTAIEVSFNNLNVAGRSYYEITMEMQDRDSSGVQIEIPDTALNGRYYAECLDGVAGHGLPLWGVYDELGTLKFSMSDRSTLEGVGMLAGYKLLEHSTFVLAAHASWNFAQIIALAGGVFLFLAIVAGVLYAKFGCICTDEKGCNCGGYGCQPHLQCCEYEADEAADVEEDAPQQRPEHGDEVVDTQYASRSANARSMPRTPRETPPTPVETTGQGESLPEGWRSAYSPQHDRTYYISPDGETKWTHPSTDL